MSYSNNAIISNRLELRSVTDVERFIKAHGRVSWKICKKRLYICFQTNERPSLCGLFADMRKNFQALYASGIFFVSYFQGPLDERCVLDADVSSFEGCFYKVVRYPIIIKLYFKRLSKSVGRCYI